MTWEYIPYQQDACDAVFATWEGGNHSALLVMPTGTGKSCTLGMIVHRAIQMEGRRALIVVHRKGLVKQIAATMNAWGLKTAIEMGGLRARKLELETERAEVVVASVQSLQGERLEEWPKQRFGLIAIDEAHHALAASYRRVCDWFEDYRLLGLTATPGRGDGKNLGAMFQSLAYRYPILTAIKEGWLAKPVFKKLMTSVDLRGIRTTGGDLNLGDLAERIGPKIEEMCRALRREIGERKTVVFTPDVGSAQALAQVLRDLGTTAKYVSGSGSEFGMPEAEKDKVLAEYDAGSFQVLVSCDLLYEGWDHPETSCVVIARPTKKQYRYVQMVGRGLRRFTDKATGAVKRDCLVLDFDWQADQDSRDIVGEFDLFDDGSLAEGVITAAKKRAKKSGREGDILDAIEHAKEDVRRRSVLAIKLTGREARYKSIEYDPVGVSKLVGVKFRKQFDMDRRGNNPASEGQIQYLRSLGVRYPEGISKWGASKLIEALKRRRDNKMATIGQVQSLLAAGVNEDLARSYTEAQAGDALKLLAAKPKTQAALFA